MTKPAVELAKKYSADALAAYGFFVGHLGKDPEAWVRDFLTDMMHLHGEEWVDNELRIARDNYRAEVEEAKRVEASSPKPV